MSSPETPRTSGRKIAVALTVIVAAALALLSLMVIVPPYTMGLFIVAVGASEYSPFLVLLDLLWCLPANRLLRGYGALRFATLAVLVASALIAVRPLTQFTHVAATASAQLGTEDGAPRFSLLTAVRGLPVSSDVVVRTIAYAAPDAERLSIRLYSQGTRALRPTVIVLYGGAWRNGSPAQCENVSRALASRGFTVAAIDYRHVPFARYPSQIDDVNHAIILVRDSSESWGIDYKRMAILGRSSGGHLAELAAFTPNEFGLKAVVALYAPFDLAEGYADLPSPDPIDVRSVLSGFLNGTPEKQPRRYQVASPSSWIRPGLPPTLLMFGARDHIVKAAFNREAAAALRAARVPVVAVELPWAEHGFDMAPAGLGAQLAFTVIVDFLERELKKNPVKVAATGR
jgi:acetyl esterase/lipase